MREIHIRNRVLVRLGNGLSAPLRREEVQRLEALAAADGFKKLSVWLAEKVRELILNGRNGVQGEPATGNRTTPHETLPVQAQGAAAVPSGGRSWAEVTDPEERIRLAAEWRTRVPIPEGFGKLPPAEKIAWMDRNWPLIAAAPTEYEW